MTHDTPGLDQRDVPDDDPLPHLVTLVGHSVPTTFEIAVAGDLDLVGADPLESAIVVSDGVAEGAIETGILEFCFSGELRNVHLADWTGRKAPESPSTPTVHVDRHLFAR